MAHTCDRPQLNIIMTSGFVSDRQWAVHAVVDCQGFGALGDRKQIEAAAQRKLIREISRECRDGRERGARSVVVLVEGDPELAGFLRGLHRDNDAPWVA
jgi:hypothetical protein